MPVSVKIDPSFTDLSDASAAIVFRDKVYPLSYTHNGLYKNDTLQIIRGEKYTLLAAWQNLSINAETTIPIPGNISLFTLQSQGSDTGKAYFLQSKVYPIANEVYAATWVLLYLNGIVGSESQVFGSVAGSNQSGYTNCITANIPSNLINFTNSRLVGRMYVYDHPFLDFYNSQNLNQVSDAIFGQTGSQVKWNIKGDGIGMFIGRTDTLITK
jgi:hypothetical protein